ncbi:N-acetyl-gamma-glutamyl-phosphate reductase [Methanocaldococcus lauensis]|uniref:N-acetyl-gamma-glutamyl-phosphate reductase n=1 Tax=Methanocaldococcus sp. TaxID=2152917 RepID=UPI001BED9626|nr:N-acetyl-gamma-glutamyl-phosphate reductase [Methanocaldococcus sp.]MCQ6253702.1 N-acetyl-gamma-glutamyl-phosphate reductase [Methanocaldococcus sp.]CAB3289680.1 N-acetyl-gamma-glutamyl-phosphate reductase [Methanocaldococcus lauensis]
MIEVSIIGATGYTGAELLRLLSNHKEVEVKYITSRKEEGKNVFKVHPYLKGIKKYENLYFTNDLDKIDVDLIFTATPHGASMNIVPDFIERGIKVIDLSGDYRFEDISLYEKYYKIKHKGLVDAKIAYGLPELHRKEIKEAQLVANPGCFPTGCILAVAPLVKERIIEERIIFDSKTGVSGAGINPTETTHFPNVNENINPYKITTHRHTPEIEKELKKLGNVKVSFTPHLAPITRGILTTAHTFLVENLDREDIIKIYERFYKDEIFIRIFPEEIPKLTWVRGTNFCDIGGFEIDEHNRLVIISAIDNLVKGASGQAIQNMNIMFGFDEKEGLFNVGLHP